MQHLPVQFRTMDPDKETGKLDRYIPKDNPKKDSKNTLARKDYK